MCLVSLVSAALEVLQRCSKRAGHNLKSQMRASHAVCFISSHEKYKIKCFLDLPHDFFYGQGGVIIHQHNTYGHY